MAAESHIAMGDLRFTKTRRSAVARRGRWQRWSLEDGILDEPPRIYKVHYKAQGVFNTIESILFRRHGTRAPPPKRCGKLPTLLEAKLQGLDRGGDGGGARLRLRRVGLGLLLRAVAPARSRASLVRIRVGVRVRGRVGVRVRVRVWVRVWVGVRVEVGLELGACPS